MQLSAETVDEIFWNALQLQPGGPRQEYLDRACRTDPGLRGQIDKLLQVQPKVEQFLEKSYGLEDSDPKDIAAAQDHVEGLGTVIGHYQLMEQLGEGGMGVVYVAEQNVPVHRRVALKIIKPGMDTKQVIARFEAERQALAMMDHPNIAKVLDGGATDGGRPYFVMELVHGNPITKYCDQQHLSVRQRLELMIPVCQAIQHAHQKGIIHRDIKPSNVLVTQYDGHPVPKVIDFGVAKAIQARRTGEESALWTNPHVGQIVGTLEYMSPEQAEFNPHDIDTRSDIYSLGVLLYELLTGVTPFDKQRFRDTAFHEMLRIIREEEPERPSSRLSRLRRTQRLGGVAVSGDLASCNRQATSRDTAPHTDTSDSAAPMRPQASIGSIAAVRSSEPARLHQTLRGELDSIVMKALEKNRDFRYESAGSLADDLRRFLSHQPISARPASLVYRFRKWLRRHPAFAIMTGFALLVFFAFTGVGSYYNRRLTMALQVARQAQAETLEREERLRLQLYAADIRMAWKAWQAGDSEDAGRRLKRHEPRPEIDDQRGFEWHYLSANCQQAIHTLHANLAPLLTADISLGDRYIASGDRAGTVRIWDFASGQERTTFRYSSQEVTCVRFAPNGQLLATCGMDRTIHLWNTADWTEQASFRGHEATVCSIAWSPDGKQLVSGGRDNKVKIWDVQQQREICTLPEQADVVRCVAWSPNGKWLATAVREDGLHLWSTKTWGLEKSLTGPGWGKILALAFSSDSRRIASGGYSGWLRLVGEPFASQPTVAEIELPHNIWSVCFSPNDGLLVAGRGDGQLHLLETRTTEGALAERTTIAVGTGAVRAALFSRDGQKLVTALEEDQLLRVQNAAALGGFRPYRCIPPCRDIAANAADMLLQESNGTLRLVQFPPASTSLAKVFQKTLATRDALFLSRGDKIVASGPGTDVQLLDPQTSAMLCTLEATDEEIRSLAVAPDAPLVAGAGISGAVWLWNAETRKLLHKLVGHQKNTVRSAFSPNGKLLATGSSNEQRVLLWDVASGLQLAELPIQQDVMGLAFSPCGAMLAVATFRDGAQIWNAAARRQDAVLRGHVGALRAVAFAPNCRTLVTAGDDGTARLWHIPTGQELLVLARRSDPIHWVKFLSPEQLVIGTAPYSTGPHGANDVLEFAATAPGND